MKIWDNIVLLTLHIMEMSETILSQFRETWLSPTINIRWVDGTVYVNGAPMTELSWGWYKYEFSAYDKTIQYLIDAVNWDEIQSTVNILDWYQNKSDWFWPRWWTIVYWLKEEEIKKTIDDIVSKIEPSWLSDALVAKIQLLQEAIDNIKIPSMPNIKVSKQWDVVDYKKIQKLIEKEAKKLDVTKDTKKTLDWILVNLMLLQWDNKEDKKTAKKEIQESIDILESMIQEWEKETEFTAIVKKLLWEAS